MSGMKSKRKGATGERELAAELRRIFGCEAYRGRQYHGGPDSPDVITPLPGHWEVKRAERLRLYDAMTQAIDEAPQGQVPIVAYRSNKRQWVVIVELDDLPKLAMQLYLWMAGPGL